MKLTKAVVERAWRNRGQAQQTLRDDEVPGLSLVVGPRAGSWRFAYKPRGTRADGTRWPTRTAVLGHLDSMDLQAARTAAIAIKGEVRLGRDPAPASRQATSERIEARAAAGATLGSLLDSYLPWLERRQRGARHIHSERCYAARAVRLLGAERDPATLKPYEIADAIGAEPRRAVARHLFGALSRMLDWAAARGAVEFNPTTRVSRPQRPRAAAPRRRRPSLAAVRQAWGAAGTLRTPKAAAGVGNVWSDLSAFLLLVPCRTGEAATATWSDIDLDRGEWHQPARLTKNGEPHVFHLPVAAVELLRRRKAEAGGNDLVFPGGRLGRRFNAYKQMLAALHHASATGGWSWHDLRRAFVSELAERGHGESVLDAILNHRQSGSRGGVLGVYQTSARSPERRAAMAAWAELVTAGGAGTTAPGAGE
jgi:integrase